MAISSAFFPPSPCISNSCIVALPALSGHVQFLWDRILCAKLLLMKDCW